MQLSDVELDHVFNVAAIVRPTSSRSGGAHATLSRAFWVIDSSTAITFFCRNTDHAIREENVVEQSGPSRLLFGLHQAASMTGGAA